MKPVRFFTAGGQHSVGTVLPRLLPFLLLFLFYSAIAWLKFGGDSWWHVDTVAGTMVSWGDDAYRFFLARQAWTNPELYWFNFALPGFVVLDGLVATLGDGILFRANLIKAFLATVSVWFVYAASRHAGAGKLSAWVSALIFALLPNYFFTALSFYGEAWFTVLIAGALYLHCSGRGRAALWVIALMPLVRAEGIWLVAAFSLWHAWRRDWAGFVIPGALGGLYFLLLVTIGPGISDFLAWRSGISEVYSAAGDYYESEISRIFDAYSITWLLLGSAALLLRGTSILRLYWVAAAIIFIYYMARLGQIPGAGHAAFEARYIASIAPVVAVGFSLACDALAERAGRLRMKGLPPTVVISLALWIFSRHALSVDAPAAITHHIGKTGRLPEIIRQRPEWPGAYFFGLEQRHLKSYRELADFVVTMLNEESDIDTLVVGNVRLFYFLDPARIPDRVRVVFPPFTWSKLGPILDREATVGYFPAHPYSAIFNLRVPDNANGLLLYVENMKVRNYPFHWKVRGHDVYLYGYGSMRRPALEQDGQGS